jgi:hypothetical protein
MRKDLRCSGSVGRFTVEMKGIMLKTSKKLVVVVQAETILYQGLLSLRIMLMRPRAPCRQGDPGRAASSPSTIWGTAPIVEAFQGITVVIFNIKTLKTWSINA